MNAPDHLALLISRASQMTPSQLFALEQAAAALLAEPADSKTPTIPTPPPACAGPCRLEGSSACAQCENGARSVDGLVDVRHGNGHSGVGWYVSDHEYSDDGSVFFEENPTDHEALVAFGYDDKELSDEQPVNMSSNYDALVSE